MPHTGIHYSPHAYTAVLKVSMASADYRVSESNGTMTVVIKKDKRIATPLALRLSPHTVAQAMMWSGVTLPNIPTDFNPNSPNRARGTVNRNYAHVQLKQ